MQIFMDQQYPALFYNGYFISQEETCTICLFLRFNYLIYSSEHLFLLSIKITAIGLRVKSFSFCPYIFFEAILISVHMNGTHRSNNKRFVHVWIFVVMSTTCIVMSFTKAMFEHGRNLVVEHIAHAQTNSVLKKNITIKSI